VQRLVQSGGFPTSQLRGSCIALIVSGGDYTRAAHTTWMLAEGVGWGGGSAGGRSITMQVGANGYVVNEQQHLRGPELDCRSICYLIVSAVNPYVPLH